MFFKLVLKGFKLKILVVEQKTAQLVELDEEPVDRQLNRSRFRSTPSSTSRGCKKLFLSFRTIVQLVKVEPQPVEVQSRSGQGVVEFKRSPAKH